MTPERIEKFNEMVNDRIDRFNKFQKEVGPKEGTLESFLMLELTLLDLKIDALEKRVFPLQD